MAHQFPDHAEFILDVARKTQVEFVTEDDGVQRPFTLHRGAGDMPFVSIRYSGYGADLLAVAHEFGHAVQLAANPGQFIPPIHREIAAFLSERALLVYAYMPGSAIAGILQTAHRDDDAIYLGNDAVELAVAQQDPNAVYNYRWNYPVARMLAARAFRHQQPKELWSTFLGQTALLELTDLVGGGNMLNTNENYLPAVPKPDKEHPAINGYRSLGMMAQLDIDYWQGQSEMPIGDYHASLLRHVQDRSAFIAFSEEMIPIGYATWSRCPDDDEAIQITRQAAPFGDHLALQKHLKSHLKKHRTVTSRHARSAREVQTAW
ncbi:hypothetical protein [uncultured Tateyamaria sp.]|uniref:hypothetical protein n=1 Tax=uncultured Tateyamaria sp. TaxID=455651 RepID=UPI002605E1A4|nr:hypothetical protein [uncultured Tateyamaria sp.]